MNSCKYTISISTKKKIQSIHDIFSLHYNLIVFLSKSLVLLPSNIQLME